MKHVLFVCTHNAGRSQIAEAFFNRLAPADLLEHRLDAIRADRTAHQLRLARLLPGLIERFPDTPDEEIRACADAVLAEYIEAPVRSFVMTIAERKARDCLASGGCAVAA